MLDSQPFLVVVVYMGVKNVTSVCLKTMLKALLMMSVSVNGVFLGGWF